MLRSLKSLFLSLVLILIIVLTVIYNTQLVFESKEKVFKIVGNIKNELVPCEALVKNPKQYTVEIDYEIFPKSLPIFINSSINFECLNKRAKKHIILFWNRFYSTQYYLNQSGDSFRDNNCPVTNCEVTMDKERYNESSLVVTHMRNKWDLSTFPKYRPNSLRTVFMLYESPYHSPNMSQYNGFYNLTSTYKIDSDFPHTAYALGMRWKRNPNFNKDFDFHGQKKAFAIAIISNCRDHSRRLELINELEKYIPVDVYGKCGKNLTMAKKCPKESAGICKKNLVEQYKFYLSFENSICDGYITEKFYQIIQYDTIPVVYGGGKYENIIPKSGYLNTNEFESIKELANRLTEIANNKSLYNSFFRWKEHVVFDVEKSTPFATICSMCIQLQLEEHIGIKKSVVEKIDQYWNKEKDCKMVRNITIK